MNSVAFRLADSAVLHAGLREDHYPIRLGWQDQAGPALACLTNQISRRLQPLGATIQLRVLGVGTLTLATCENRFSGRFQPLFLLLRRAGCS